MLNQCGQGEISGSHSGKYKYDFLLWYAVLSGRNWTMAWWWRQQAPLKRRSFSTRRHGTTSQNAAVFDEDNPVFFYFRNLFSRLSEQMRACKSRDCLLSTMQEDRTHFRLSQIKKANKTRWHYESLICDWKYTSRNNGMTPAFAPEVHIDAKTPYV
jgi:hypothetical protein